MTRLVLATGNEGKARELRSLLPASFDIVTSTSLGLSIPEESGSTFEENARIKAIGVSLLVPGLVIADDSGLEVDALDGRPGVHSARYAGEPPDDAANIRLLLRELDGTPGHDRAGRFVCTLCVARSGVVLALVHGYVEGWISERPRGTSGFGYDPVFIDADGRSMAEMTVEEKNAISHRGAALRRLIPMLTGGADGPPAPWASQ